MATTVNLRKLLDRKSWEMMAPSPITAAATAALVVATPPQFPVPMVFTSSGTATHYMYFPNEDSYLLLPSGTLGAHTTGSCGAFHPFGPTFTASAGSTTTATSTLTIPGSMIGMKMRCTSGTGAGQEVTITNNTTGANAVFTFTTQSTGFDNTSVFQTLFGRFWILAATSAAVTWKYYDVATNAWTSKSVTSGPGATWAGDGAAVVTSQSAVSSTGLATGTATAGAAATLTNGGKAWTSNQWANYQVRITGGVGAGQVRTINSNTGTVLTVSANWGTNPDATSIYVIEGNDDWIWVIGNGAVTLFRYAITGIAALSATTAQATGDTWVTVSPGAARSAAPTASFSWNYIANSTSTNFATENTIKNGQRIYSFRGGASATLDYYDIAANTWVSGVTYGLSGETFTSGATYCDDEAGNIYIRKENASAIARWYKFDAGANTITPWNTLLYPDGGSHTGQSCFVMQYTDGGTTIRWVYHFRKTGTELFRCMVI